MRKELLYVAGGMALVLFLGAAPMPNWKGVSVRTDVPGNTSSVSSITFVGGVTAAQFVGDGSLLSGIATMSLTNGLASTNYVNAAVAGATNGLSGTNQLWDVDTLTAPATSGSVVYDDPGFGDTFDHLSIAVYPIYSNAIGRVFGTPLTDEQNLTMAYYRWTWDAQAGAVGYFVHIHNYFPEEDKYVEQTATSIIPSNPFSGSDITPKPSSAARTNEVVSTWLVTGDEPGVIVSPSWTNGLVPWATTNLFQPWISTNNFVPWTATNGFNINPFPETNRTVYVSSGYSGVPPFYTNLIAALDSFSSAVAGTATNYGTVRISGHLSIPAQAAKTYSAAPYNYMKIVADDNAVVLADVSSAGNNQQLIIVTASNVTVAGGTWIATATGSANVGLFGLKGYRPSLLGVRVLCRGDNSTMCNGVWLQGSRDFLARNCWFSIVPGTPAASPIETWSSTNAMLWSCLLDGSAIANYRANLGNCLTPKFLYCVMLHSNTAASSPMWDSLAENTVFEGCSFINYGSAPTLGKEADANRTIWLVNTTFNTNNWLGDSGTTVKGTNFFSIDGYPGTVPKAWEF